MALSKPNRRKPQKKTSRGSQLMVIFWLVFVVVIIGVFMVNSETIKRNFDFFKTRVTSSPNAVEEDPLPLEELPSVNVIVEPLPTVRETPAPTRPVETPTPPAQTQQQTQTQTTTTVTVPPPATTPPVPPPVQTRDRAIYFTHIDRDGQILQSKVTRRIQVSETPMQDTLNTMLAGLSNDELNKGIINLIPQNTRLISATVRGNTAYLNFSDDFMLNTFGVEGYVAQLRQIVWTVTEFQNVNDVQILIEGRRLDYLGEGVWIGSPISRQSF